MKRGVVIRLIAVILSISAIMTSIPMANAYQHPQGLWAYFDRWNEAVENGYYGTILELAPIIEGLYAGESLCEANAQMLANVSLNAARASEARGNLEAAVTWLRKQLEYDLYLNDFGPEYADRITTTRALIRHLDVDTDIYAVTASSGKTPYYGAIAEPRSGILHGVITGTEPVGNESASFIYVEFEPYSEHDMAYWIDYFGREDELFNRGAVTQIAWNFPLEGNQISDIVSGRNDAYIIESAKALATYSNQFLLRIAAEMNVWTDLPDKGEFIAAFRRIANLVRQYSDNAAIVFSPNDISVWGDEYRDYYPGDEYVDWIGVSVYPTVNTLDEKQEIAAFYSRGVYSANPLVRIRELTETFTNKPFMISECGFAHTDPKTGDLTDKAALLLRRFYTYLPMVYPQVKAVFYFNRRMDERDSKDYTLHKKQPLLDAYMDAVYSDSYISGKAGSANGYIRLSELNEKQNKLKLAVYAVFPSESPVEAKYYLDGVHVKTTNQAPLAYEISINALTPGVYTVRADITCGNIERSVTRSFTVSADGTITGGEKPSAVTTMPTASTVLVNGVSTAFEAYNINDNNYFKLRDIAYVLNGTRSQFEVTWDSTLNAISLYSGRSYTIAGGEMASAATASNSAVPTSSTIYLDGQQIYLTAYNIGGNNYFKLRDIGQAFDFGVDWLEASGTIAIDSSKSYTST